MRRLFDRIRWLLRPTKRTRESRLTPAQLARLRSNLRALISSKEHLAEN